MIARGRVTAGADERWAARLAVLIWCVGVRAIPPFGAHAWVVADGHDVDEPYPPDHHRTLFQVEPGPCGPLAGVVP